MEEAVKAIALLQSDLISTQRRNAELQQQRRDQIEEQDLMAAAFRAKDEELASVMEQLALVETEKRMLEEDNSALRAKMQQSSADAAQGDLARPVEDHAQKRFGFNQHTEKEVLLGQLTRVYQLLEEERRLRFGREETIQKQQQMLQELQDDLEEYAEVRALRDARPQREQEVDEPPEEPPLLPESLGGSGPEPAPEEAAAANSDAEEEQQQEPTSAAQAAEADVTVASKGPAAAAASSASAEDEHANEIDDGNRKDSFDDDILFMDAMEEESDEAILEQLNQQLEANSQALAGEGSEAGVDAGDTDETGVKANEGEGEGEGESSSGDGGNGGGGSSRNPTTPDRPTVPVPAPMTPLTPAMAAASASPCALAAAAAASRAAASAAHTVGVAQPDALQCSKAVQMLARVRAHAEGGDDVLFIIHRSNNSNVVVYKGDGTKGVHVFWIMFEKEGAPTEGLTTLERNTAYGVSCVPKAGEPGRWEMKISALRDRSIEICCEEQVVGDDDGDGAGAKGAGAGEQDAHETSRDDANPRNRKRKRWWATTEVNGTEGVMLRAVHVQMAKSFVPSVSYIEIFGQKNRRLPSALADSEQQSRQHRQLLRWHYEMKEQAKGSGTDARAVWQGERSRAKASAAKLATEYIATAEEEEQARADAAAEEEAAEAEAEWERAQAREQRAHGSGKGSGSGSGSGGDRSPAGGIASFFGSECEVSDEGGAAGGAPATGSSRPTVHNVNGGRRGGAGAGGAAEGGGAGVVRVIRTAGNSPRGYIPQASEEPDAGEVDAWMLSMGSKDGGSSSNGSAADPAGTGSSDGKLGRGEASGLGLGVRRQPQYRSEWKEVRCNHPLPPFGISSPVIRHLLQSATTTRARAESVKEWLEHVESGGLLRADFPLDMVLSALEPEVRDGFIKLVVPVLQRRTDIEVLVQVKEHATARSPDGSTETSLADLRIQLHSASHLQRHHKRTPSYQDFSSERLTQMSRMGAAVKFGGSGRPPLG